MLNEEMRAAIDACAVRSSAHLIDLIVRGQSGRTVVEVFIDAESIVTTELCAEVSREAALAIDRGGWIRGSYRMEVSSPGIERPLKFPWQYAKHVGREVAVTSVGGEKKEGKLTEVNEQGIVVGGETIGFGSIVETVVKAPW